MTESEWASVLLTAHYSIFFDFETYTEFFAYVDAA